MKLGELQTVENDVIPLITTFPTDTDLVYNARKQSLGQAAAAAAAATAAATAAAAAAAEQLHVGVKVDVSVVLMRA
jgi:hypothetical protein